MAAEDAEKHNAAYHEMFPSGVVAVQISEYIMVRRFIALLHANADPVHIGLPWAGVRMICEVSMYSL
ncbi:hypothetical protein M433DRAFT_146669 [Acidomyces richmondensis BFW]|nr:hypothetical protein M433DRAFT_146669 [Acidomyces richmondensis BFW]